MFELQWGTGKLLETLEMIKQVSRGEDGVLHFTRIAILLEYLAEAVQFYPIQSLQCLRIIAELDRKRWNLYSEREHVGKILTSALQFPDSKELAQQTINYLISFGYTEFRDLLRNKLT